MRIVDGTARSVLRKGVGYLRFSMVEGADVFHVSINTRKLKRMAARAARNKYHKSIGGPVTVRHAQ